jgi:osmotically inducible protein OsmC
MDELSKVLYTARGTAEGGRDGHSASDDGQVDVRMVTPPELGGGGGAGTNPEQLFAVGFASCFHSALKIVARRLKLDAEGSTVTAEVGIGPKSEGVGFGLTVALTVALPGIPDREQAQQLVDAADAVCPYSNAIRGNVPKTLHVAATPR